MSNASFSEAKPGLRKSLPRIAANKGESSGISEGLASGVGGGGGAGAALHHG